MKSILLLVGAFAAVANAAAAIARDTPVDPVNAALAWLLVACWLGLDAGKS